MNQKFFTALIACSVLIITACKNEDIDFPNFEYQTVYFANQYPLRTIELGDDDYVDLTTDNDHKLKIIARLGGARKNTENRIVKFKIDEDLCDGLIFADDGTDVVPLPKEYYMVADDKILIPKGQNKGELEISLTDKFFTDPLSLTRHYVIPVLLTNVENGDSILQGYSTLPDPNRFKEDDWVTAPKDYVLYAVKYVNPWSGLYLRHGRDILIKGESQQTVYRHNNYVEDDEIVEITTIGLNEALLSLYIFDDEGKRVPYQLKLSFDNQGNCKVYPYMTDAIEADGDGRFVAKGEKNSFGGKDRNALYLNYTVMFRELGGMSVQTTDTLVVQTRNISPEYFNVSLK